MNEKAEHGSALRAVHTPLPTMGHPQRIPLQEAPMHVRLLGAAALTACLAAAGCASSPYNDGYYGASAPPTLACYNDCGTRSAERRAGKEARGRERTYAAQE